MSEAHLQPGSKPMSVWGIVMTTLSTLFFTLVAAGCFLCVANGIRAIQQRSVSAVLSQIDAMLKIQTWIAPPAWVNAVITFYHQQHVLTAQVSNACLGRLVSSVSSDLPDFKYATHSQETNPFTQGFSQTCSVVKYQLLPLLSGCSAVIAMRLWVLMTALPLFLLSLSMGLVDGLVQRDIRKFQGARESTLLFHRIKRCGAVIFFLPLLAYFAWLSPVSPLWFLMPMAIALGCWLALGLRLFKKYV